jgi:hypothetical protein
MIKAIAIIVAVLLAGILIFAATRPDTFRVQRSTSIKALPERIFPLINDLQRWGAWSPYEKRDPAMKRTFGATTAGKGAVYEWDGNKAVGKFTLNGKGDATSVTWAMYGRASFVSKLMGVFFDMDNMIGKDFEAGLASLKAIAEK